MDVSRRPRRPYSLVGMQFALLGFVLPNQVGNAVLGELVGDVPGECIVVHYLLIQLSAFFAHEMVPNTRFWNGTFVLIRTPQLEAVIFPLPSQALHLMG